MARSYELINYSLRPAKSVERKMLVEAFHHLSPFVSVESYRYIGFGSPYFTDFVLFHKILGIDRMISIEKDNENESRFNFNRPFKCITIEFGDSNDVLPRLGWSSPTILWLDYDGKLNTSVLSDVALFVNSAVAGSILLVTVNVEPDKPIRRRNRFDGIEKFRKQQLINDVGEERVPLGITGKHLSEWSKAKVCRQIIINEIRSTLNVVNGGREPAKELLFKQIFHFNYADGARMLTVGGLLYEKDQADIVKRCAFEELPFFRESEDPYLIETPHLTYRELRHLDTLLPVGLGEKLEWEIAIPDTDLDRYQKVYRYFPLFAETEV